MSALRKQRSDSKLGKLSQEQRAQLADMLMHGGLSLLEVRDWVKREFGIACGTTALCNFHSRVCQPLYRARLSESAAAAEKAGDVLRDAHVFDAATIAGVKQMVFETISSGADAERVTKLMSLFLHLRDQDIKQQQLALGREKFEFDAAKRAMEEAAKIKAVRDDAGLNSDQKIAAVRRVLFGISAEKGKAE